MAQASALPDISVMMYAVRGERRLQLKNEGALGEKSLSGSRIFIVALWRSVQVVGVREVCGVCLLSGGALSLCFQCLHLLSLPKVGQTSKTQEQSYSETILHKYELDFIVGDQGSKDGVLQRAFHNTSRPLSDTRGNFQWNTHTRV